jgi:hypothetical protein
MKLKRIVLSLGFVPLLCVPALGAIVVPSDAMHDSTSDPIIAAQGSTGSGGGSGSGTDTGGGGSRSGISALESTTGGGTSSPGDSSKNPPCEIKEGEAERKAEQNQMQSSHMIRGEVIKVEDSNYVVKEQEGKQVSLKTDETTAQPAIHEGEHIEASVNEQNQVLWIRTDNSTDRRNEHAATDCTPN